MPRLTQTELAHRELRQVALSAPPDQHLGEEEWSARLSVGRFAVRQALKQLHGEGLVCKMRGKYRIPVLNADDAREISHLRVVLEAGVIRTLERKLPRELLREIRQAASDFAGMIDRQYSGGANEADLRFHRAIITGSRNPRLIRLYEISNLPILRPAGKITPEMFRHAARDVKEHDAICGALERGANDRAARLLEEHLKRASRGVIKRWAENARRTPARSSVRRGRRPSAGPRH